MFRVGGAHITILGFLENIPIYLGDGPFSAIHIAPVKFRVLDTLGYYMILGQ